MKKIIVLLMLVFIGASTTIYAQESKSESRRAERKAQRDAIKAQEKIEEERAYADAVQAIKERKFVLEADRVTFKRGRSAFVTSNTNFILLNGEKASVQVAFNGAFAGPNGIGGVTVDGRVGDIKTTTDKKGNVSCSFNVIGVGISAQVSIRLAHGSNNASATINPNFNSNRLSLDGKLIPLSESSVFKGRSF
ncbi:DUF4251 domain-containing protein [Bacteroides timonensis]|uniref:DUF4251 domain-containing protein n=1 Tax=Bacteroides timonensis TaxID=1470345 RepID=UPI0004ACC678|nr:DUF4251 domain-containing protein [Bacteroides timonensis]